MVALPRKRVGILRKRIPAAFFIPILLVFCIAAFFINKKGKTMHASQQAVAAPTYENELFYYRMNGFQLTRPLLLSGLKTESADLRGIKIELSGFLSEKKAAGEITNGSVYIQQLMNGGWTSINSDEVYVAGSMMKIPTMMAFLKDAETHPGLLQKKIYYDKVPGDMSLQTFNDGSITTGKSYTIRELIDYMITRSDNHATMLLDKSLSFDQINRLFSDLDLPTVDFNSQYYRVTAPQYSRFLQVLFSATYLSRDNANFAMELLTHTTFSTGLAAGLPHDVKIAHKFGEAGSEVPGESQLHETGIIFLEGNPYLITVMTKGMDVQKLPNIISEISRRTYAFMKTSTSS